MKIYQAHNKYFCQIKVGDTLYIVHDNDTNNYELNYDGRLVLNTLKYIDLYSHKKSQLSVN